MKYHRYTLKQAATETGVRYGTLYRAMKTRMQQDNTFKVETIVYGLSNTSYFLTPEQVKILCPNWEGVK